MVKLRVFEKDGAWWFKWWDFVEPGAVFLKGGVPAKAPEMPLAQGVEGPFGSRQEADLARENFAQRRKEKHPYESVDSE